MCEKQYWADACTRNCVWCFQIRIDTGNDEQEFWHTKRIFLTEKEALAYGNSRPHAWGEYMKEWKIWGIPCNGIMAELLGRHVKEFEKDVEYIG